MTKQKSWHLEAIRLSEVKTPNGVHLNSWNSIARALDIPASTMTDFLRKHHKGYVKPKDKSEKLKHKPRILLFDLETSPTKAWVWGRFKQFLQQSQILSEQFLLSYSAKWFNDSDVFGEVLSPKKVLKENDRELVEALWHLLDEADVVIGHNAKAFDCKVINARFAYYGMNPPSPYKVIDTLLIAKKHFRFPSNKLDSLGVYFKVGRKTETGGFDLWASCCEGDLESLELMLEYNIQDVLLLELIWLKLRKWDNEGVNFALYQDSTKLMCPNCGSEDLKHEPDRFAYTAQSRYAVYRCNGCGAIKRDKINLAKRTRLTHIA